MQDFFGENWYDQMKAHILVYLWPFYKCQWLGKSKINDFLVYYSKRQGAHWTTGSGDGSAGVYTNASILFQPLFL